MTYVDGEEESREKDSEEVTKEPVSEVVLRGTAERENTSGGIDVEGGNGTGEVAGTFTDMYGNTVSYSSMMTGTCTAYSVPGGTTSLGWDAVYGVVAVNPNIIPYGTKMYITSPDGSVVYGYGVAGDTGGAAMARRLHLLCSYWGFVLMSLHLGLHWGMVVGMVRKALRLPASKVRATALRVVAGGIALYGAYCFLFRYQLWLYLFRQAEFVLFDAFSRPAILFYVDHVAMMGAFVLLSYGLTRLLQARKRGGASV